MLVNEGRSRRGMPRVPQQLCFGYFFPSFLVPDWVFTYDAAGGHSLCDSRYIANISQHSCQNINGPQISHLRV